jgi:DNA repair protein RadC
MERLPHEERPRERLLKYGAESLATAELVAIILGSGTKTMPVLQLAQEIVARFGSTDTLAQATIEELQAIKGVGVAKALQLKAALTLGLRASRQNSSNTRFFIEFPIHAYQYIRRDLEKEQRELFVVILQDTKGYVICHEVVSIGTLSQVLVHPREVFYPAIRHKAASMVLAHNHPSGDPTPSPQDIEVTKQLIHVGGVMSIPVNDHIIVGKERYVSLRQLFAETA